MNDSHDGDQPPPLPAKGSEIQSDQSHLVISTRDDGAVVNPTYGSAADDTRDGGAVVNPAYGSAADDARDDGAAVSLTYGSAADNARDGGAVVNPAYGSAADDVRGDGVVVNPAYGSAADNARDDGAVANPAYGSAADDTRGNGAVVNPTYAGAAATTTTAAAAATNTLYSVPMDTVAAGTDRRASSAGGGAVVVVEAVQNGSSQPHSQVSAAGNDGRSSSMSWKMVGSNTTVGEGLSPEQAPGMARHSSAATTGGLWAWIKAHRLLALVAVLIAAIVVLAVVAATSNDSSSAVDGEPATPMMPYPKEMEMAPQGFVPFAMRSREGRDAMVGLRKTYQALTALKNGDAEAARSAIGRSSTAYSGNVANASTNPIEFVENGGLDALILPDDPAEAGAVYVHNFTTILAAGPSARRRHARMLRSVNGSEPGSDQGWATNPLFCQYYVDEYTCLAVEQRDDSVDVDRSQSQGEGSSNYSSSTLQQYTITLHKLPIKLVNVPLMNATRLFNAALLGIDFGQASSSVNEGAARRHRARRRAEEGQEAKQMQKGSRTRRRPVGEHAENMGYRSGDVGSNGINTHRMLEQHKYNNFLGTQKTNMQNKQHAKEVNTFNTAFNAAKKGAISDIDPGFKTALANNFQEQCNNQNLGNIGLVGVRGAVEDVAKAGWFGWNNPFAMFSSKTTANVANNVVGTVGYVSNADALMNGAFLGKLGRVTGKIAAPIGTTSAIAFALDTAITVTTTVQVKCAIGIKSGHLSMPPDDRRNRRDGSEVNDMCACFAISNTDADEDICYASFTKYSDSPLEVFPSTYAEFCEEYGAIIPLIGGETGCDSIDCDCYRARYSDLENVTCNQACAHYADYGFWESRIPGCDGKAAPKAPQLPGDALPLPPDGCNVVPRCYARRYPELGRAGIRGDEALCAHYEEHGRAEGREPKCTPLGAQRECESCNCCAPDGCHSACSVAYGSTGTCTSPTSRDPEECCTCTSTENPRSREEMLADFMYAITVAPDADDKSNSGTIADAAGGTANDVVIAAPDCSSCAPDGCPTLCNAKVGKPGFCAVHDSTDPDNCCAASDGGTCADVNECARADVEFCGPGNTCINGFHKYTCKCGLGWQGGGDNTLCTPIDYCKDVDCGGGSSTCSNAVVGHYACNCGAGWSGGGMDKVCTPVNECEAVTCGGIDSKCTDSINAFICECGFGMEGGGLNTLCQDVDECAGVVCGGEVSTCANGLGHFVCNCGAGFSGGGKNQLCEDIDECANVVCGGASSVCTDMLNGFHCECAEGWTGGGDNIGCVPMPEFGAFCFDCSCYLARYPDELAVLSLGITADCNDDDVSKALLNHYKQVGVSERQNPCCCEVETIPSRRRKAAKFDLDLPPREVLSWLREDVAIEYYSESELGRERRQGEGPGGVPGPPPPPVNHCSPNPCGYGSCSWIPGNRETAEHVYCTCYAGSTRGGGRYGPCQDPPNWCVGVSCGPGGTCLSYGTHYACSCAAGSSGGDVNTPCVDVNECSGISCGGASSTCVNGNNKYSCICGNGWTGGGVNTKCTNINECSSVNCGGASQCVDGDNSFTCNCANGWKGGGTNAVCTDVDECAGVTCGGKSTCANQLAKYSCQCAAGWAGGGTNAVCSNVDDCQGVNCGGSSECVDGINQFTCTCADGWKNGGVDQVCTDVDECVGIDCGGASTCNNHENKFLCTCAPGWTSSGANNEVCVDLDECTAVTCGGESVCVNGANKFTCECASGWSGGGGDTVCINIDDCDGIVCGGDSVCVDEVNSYTCVCAAGWTGGGTNTGCVDVDECEGVDCGGESTCSNELNHYTCSCADGWIGGCKNTVCTAAKCPSPSAPGLLSTGCTGKRTGQGGCTFTCADGYQLLIDGSDTAAVGEEVVCQATGEGTAEFLRAPTCVPVICPEPSKMVGRVASSGCAGKHTDQAGCSVTCEIGFALSEGAAGNKMCAATSAETSAFSELPVCVPVKCSQPPPQDGRSFVGCSGKVTNEIGCTVTCNSGYGVESGDEGAKACIGVGSGASSFTTLPHCVPCAGVPSGPAYDDGCAGLTTGGNCTQGCSDGYSSGSFMCSANSTVYGDADVLLSNGNMSDAGMTFDQCKTECASKPSCASFVYVQQETYCELWSARAPEKDENAGPMQCAKLFVLANKDDALTSTSYKCPAGTLELSSQLQLQCMPDDCTSQLPAIYSGAGYNMSECRDFATDTAACTVSCAAGYTHVPAAGVDASNRDADNSDGSGHGLVETATPILGADADADAQAVHRCPGGVHTLDTTSAAAPLRCMPLPCTQLPKFETDSTAYKVPARQLWNSNSDALASNDCSKMLTGQVCSQRCADGYASGSEVSTTYSCPDGIFQGKLLQCRQGEPTEQMTVAVKQSESLTSGGGGISAQSMLPAASGSKNTSSTAVTLLVALAVVVACLVAGMLLMRHQRMNGSERDSSRDRGETLEMMENPMHAAGAKAKNANVPVAINPHFVSGGAAGQTLYAIPTEECEARAGPDFVALDSDKSTSGAAPLYLEPVAVGVDYEYGGVAPQAGAEPFGQIYSVYGGDGVEVNRAAEGDNAGHMYVAPNSEQQPGDGSVDQKEAAATGIAYVAPHSDNGGAGAAMLYSVPMEAPPKETVYSVPMDTAAETAVSSPDYVSLAEQTQQPQHVAVYSVSPGSSSSSATKCIATDADVGSMLYTSEVEGYLTVGGADSIYSAAVTAAGQGGHDYAAVLVQHRQGHDYAGVAKPDGIAAEASGVYAVPVEDAAAVRDRSGTIC